MKGYKKGIKRHLGSVMNKPALPLVAGIVLLSVVLGFVSPYFWTISNFAVLLKIATTLTFLALGVNFLLIVGEMDISFVSVMNLTAMIVALTTAHLHWLLGILIAVSCAALVGTINGYFTVYVGIPSFLTTLATSAAVQGVVYLISGYRSVPVRTDAISCLFRSKLPFNFDVSVFWAIGAVLLSSFFLSRTRFGRNMYAIGGNAQAAARKGVPVKKIKFRLFIVAALTAAMAGLIEMGRVGAVRPNLGAGSMMPTIAAPILGGASLTGGEGSVGRTVLGVLLLRLIVVGFNLLGLEPATQDIAMGFIVIGTLTLRLLSRSRKLQE